MKHALIRPIILHEDRISCSFSPIGASIVDITLTAPNGFLRSVALSPLTHLDGRNDPSLAGRTIAPCCGRVRDGSASLNGISFTLDQNENSNHIHGGYHSTAYQLWQVHSVSDTRVVFTLDLPHGLSGYPGNRHITADYTLETNALKVRYTATTDSPTWIDFTNHVYWDLSGQFDGSAMEQSLYASSTQHVCNDENHLPVSICDSRDTCFDFTSPHSFREMMDCFPDDRQLLIARGYNNALILDPALARESGYAARLASPNGDLRMLMYTDQPSIVLYSGGFLGEDTPLSGKPSIPGCAIAMEAQGFPDPFHLPGVFPEILQPKCEFSRYIKWEFRFECE